MNRHNTKETHQDLIIDTKAINTILIEFSPDDIYIKINSFEVWLERKSNHSLYTVISSKLLGYTKAVTRLLSNQESKLHQFADVS